MRKLSRMKFYKDILESFKHSLREVAREATDNLIDFNTCSITFGRENDVDVFPKGTPDLKENTKILMDFAAKIIARGVRERLWYYSSYYMFANLLQGIENCRFMDFRRCSSVRVSDEDDFLDNRDIALCVYLCKTEMTIRNITDDISIYRFKPFTNFTMRCDGGLFPDRGRIDVSCLLTSICIWAVEDTEILGMFNDFLHPIG